MHHSAASRSTTSAAETRPRFFATPAPSRRSEGQHSTHTRPPAHTNRLACRRSSAPCGNATSAASAAQCHGWACSALLWMGAGLTTCFSTGRSTCVRRPRNETRCLRLRDIAQHSRGQELLASPGLRRQSPSGKKPREISDSAPVHAPTFRPRVAVLVVPGKHRQGAVAGKHPLGLASSAAGSAPGSILLAGSWADRECWRDRVCLHRRCGNEARALVKA
ncbi:uncharacterized protein BDZ99DRAFT_476741 [Mytilinidion resinicola]|uniref:Uncharacterized protein n=1 Tax=Mytilinidion resinicola TaxID=574789 RepID=A0A6A6YL87_9PEZI|nr:uncharacterized protein BDZ99DRAFT_476741 [Mytilinidion resinicola]KAF2809298.1 hypothetical protein BDZ99DRAFT_476741 [Mytilinidion resinicola]